MIILLSFSGTACNWCRFFNPKPEIVEKLHRFREKFHILKLSKRKFHLEQASRAGLCSDASLEVFYVNYLNEVFYVENR